MGRIDCLRSIINGDIGHEMKKKVKWLAPLVALITIVGSLILGGANYGDVTATVHQHEVRLSEIGEKINRIDERTQDMGIMNERIATDLSWIKLALMDLREKQNNGKED